MPEVSVVVELKVVVDPGADPVALEQAVATQGRQAAKELYRAALEQVDRDAVEASGGARQRLEERWVATLAGRMRIWRYRVKVDGVSYCPLDRALGWGHKEATPALREALCDLALRLPYRQAAEVCSRITGEPLHHLSVWRILVEEGTRVRAEDGRLVESIFELGEAPPEDTPAPDLVVAEGDGTFLRAQGEDSDRFEVKTGVVYTGKERAGGRKHRRWRLVNKGCYATTADADAFGRGLAACGFWWVGLHKATWVLVGHDGLDEYGQTFRGYFPGAVHQVDHFHVAKRLWEISGNDPRRHAGLCRRAFSDPVGLARSLRRDRWSAPVDKRLEVATYLDAVAPNLWGIDRLPPGLRRGRMRIVGTGVVEKHQDLLVGRRMKRRGMRWTRRGAEAQLALQGRRLCGRWPTRWGVIDR
ncbi:MAG: UPF0236 family protein [Actinomycetota bacterium]|nr:UPF0236 family protein [Actinomycetota bacterium]